MNAPAAVEGVCDLCGQEMVKVTDPLDAYHPAEVIRASGILCPPEPARDAWNPDDPDGWPAFYAKGLRPGRPGLEHWKPTA